MNSNFYRSSYDYTGYGFDATPAIPTDGDATYWSDLSLPNESLGQVRKDAWYIVISMNDAKLSDNTDQFKWGVTGSNWAPISDINAPTFEGTDIEDNADFQRYLDLDIDMLNGSPDAIQTPGNQFNEMLVGSQEKKAGGYLRNMFKMKEGHWRRTVSEPFGYVSGWPAKPQPKAYSFYPEAFDYLVPERALKKDIFTQSATSYEYSRILGRNSDELSIGGSIEALFTKSKVHSHVGSVNGAGRYEFAPDMFGHYHKNWGLYNTIRMAHAINHAYYDCKPTYGTTTACNGTYDYISPDGFITQRCGNTAAASEVPFPIGGMSAAFNCGCDNAPPNENGTGGFLIGCDDSSDSRFGPYNRSSFPQDVRAIGLTSRGDYYEEYKLREPYGLSDFTPQGINHDSLKDYYNAQAYIGKYLFGKIQSIGSTAAEADARLSAVHAVRTKFDDRATSPDRFSGAEQPCPDQYCDPANNLLYPNPPFMSPWYLPSPDEMAFIARKVALEGLNDKLVELGGDPIVGEYWTSMGAFDFSGKLIDVSAARSKLSEIFQNVDLSPFQEFLPTDPEERVAAFVSGSALPTDPAEKERYETIREKMIEWNEYMITGQSTHLANPEGLLFTGTTGATTGIGTGPADGMTGLAPFVGTKVPRSDNRLRQGHGDEIVGHMTRAWAMKFPDNISIQNPTEGFSSRKLRKDSDTAKVRPIRLVRADGRYPRAGFDRYNPEQSGIWHDKHARLWYIPYVFNSSEPGANPEINKHHFIHEAAGVTGPANIYNSGFRHNRPQDREWNYLVGTPGIPDGARQQFPSEFIGEKYGSCTTSSGYCFVTSRYECVNYYAGKFGGEGSRCPREVINTYARAVNKTGQSLLEEYSRGTLPTQNRSAGSINRSAGMSNPGMGGSQSSGY